MFKTSKTDKHDGSVLLEIESNRLNCLNEQSAWGFSLGYNNRGCPTLLPMFFITRDFNKSTPQKRVVKRMIFHDKILWMSFQFYFQPYKR